MKSCFFGILFFVLINPLLYFRITVPFSIQISGVASETFAELSNRGDAWYQESNSRSSSASPTISPTGQPLTDPYAEQLIRNMQDASLRSDMHEASTSMFWPYFLLNLVKNRFVPTVYFCLAFLIFAVLCRDAFTSLPAFLAPFGYGLVAFMLVPAIANAIWPPIVNVDESFLEFAKKSHSINKYGFYSFIVLLIAQVLGSLLLSGVAASPSEVSSTNGS